MKKQTKKPAEKAGRNKTPFNKYTYYENSVQTPTEHVHIFDRMFTELRGKQAISLREDFCGTFMISCEWIKSHPKRESLGLDLDPEPIAYGKSHAYKTLTAGEKKRVQIVEQDVCVPFRKKVDIIGAGNFSFYIFKQRKQLKAYFKAALASLNPDGIHVLEMAGGPGFITHSREQKTYTVKEIGRYTYYWDQKFFDPINRHGLYAIHFKSPDGVMHRDAFVYDWRVWTLPEVKELMLESGFKDVAVYWEGFRPNGEGNGEYVKTEVGDNSYSWIAFVVGIK